MTEEYREISFLLKAATLVKTPEFVFSPIRIIRRGKEEIGKIKTDNLSEMTVRDWVIQRINDILRYRKAIDEETKPGKAES